MNLNQLKDAHGLDRENILKQFGLQNYRSGAWAAIPGVALFGLGVLVGAGVGMLFAPKTGQELRGDLTERMNSMRFGGQADSETEEGSSTANMRPSETVSDISDMETPV